MIEAPTLVAPCSRVVEYVSTLKRQDIGRLWSSRASSDSANNLDPIHVQQFREGGYAVIPNFLHPAQINLLTAACDRLDELVRDLERSYDDINLEAPGGGWERQARSLPYHTGRIRKVSNLLDHGQAFCDLALSPSLLGAVSSLIGPLFELHSKGFLMNKPPGVSSLKPLHQDAAYFPLTDGREVITVWIPLQRVTEENGALYVIPGSHLWGLLPHLRPEATLDLANIDRTAMRVCPMEVGSVFFGHQYLVHGSGTNRTSSPRRALLLRYVSSENNRQVVATLARPRRLGGGPAEMLIAGDRAAHIEKRHLILNRVMRERAAAQGVTYFDLGTDFSYPFFDTFGPTCSALQAVADHARSALHYPSSYGIKTLRAAFVSWFKRIFGVDLDPTHEVMICTGASQCFDALTRSLAGTYVLLPDLALPTVSTIAQANGAAIIRIPRDERTGMMDLSILDHALHNIAARNESVRFIYLNSPCNPTGAIATRSYLSNLVRISREHRALLLHDMDSWTQTHDGSALANVLEMKDAIDCSITVLSISKEFGLPGLRVGLIAGNRYVVDTIRVHNSTFCVMVPELNQEAARAALETFDSSELRSEVSAYVTATLHRSVQGWISLGWPREQICHPRAGYKYLIAVPPAIRGARHFSAVEIFDFFLASRCFVKLSTTRSFNPYNDQMLRVVLMQQLPALDDIFRRLHENHVHYGMTLDSSIADEYEEFEQRYAREEF